MLSRKRHRLSVLAVAAVLMLLAGSGAVHAQDQPRRPVTDGHTEDNKVVIKAGLMIRAVEAGAEEGESNGCEWREYVADDLASPIFESGIEDANDSPFQTDNLDYGTARLFSSTGQWFEARNCTDPAITGVYAVGIPISLPDLVGLAVGDLDPSPPPPFGTSPPWDDPDRFAVVRIPTWFWVDDPFRSTVLTSRVNFPSDANPRVWTEATGVPDRIQINPGDGTGWAATGEDSNCPSLGKIWNVGMAEDEADCYHTFTRSSAGRPNNAFQVRGRVWFETSWTSNVSPGGALAPIFRESAPQPLRVGEILAVSS